MTFSPLLFAQDALPEQAPWLTAIVLAMLGASAWVWIAWQRSNSLGRDFFGPRDYRSETVRPWGQFVLLSFLAMILAGIGTIAIYSDGLQQLPADPAAPERLALQSELIRWNLGANALTLALVLGFCFWQVQLTAGQQVPFRGLIPNWRDLRNGLLLGVACVPLLYMLQGLLQYIAIQVLNQPQIEHPLIELLRRNKDADQNSNYELLGWIAISVTVIAPLLEEILFRGLLQGWLRARYVTLTAKLLTPSGGKPFTPNGNSDNPYQAPQAPLVSANANLQRVRLNTWAPNFITSLVFALFHVGHGPATISIFFFSLGLGYLYEKTGRLAPSIIAHLMLNLSTTVILGLTIMGRLAWD